jgi:drug/metabolite transporter (DMT)-like permease
MVKIRGRFDEGSGQETAGRCPPQRLGYASGLLATLLWGSSFGGSKLLMSELSPLTVQAGRFALGAVRFMQRNPGIEKS